MYAFSIHTILFTVIKKMFTMSCLVKTHSQNMMNILRALCYKIKINKVLLVKEGLEDLYKISKIVISR